MDPTEVRKIAKLARIRLDAVEERELAAELSSLLGHFQELQKLSTESIHLETHTTPGVDALREDTPEPWPRPRDLVEASKDSERALFNVPRILE